MKAIHLNTLVGYGHNWMSLQEGRLEPALMMMMPIPLMEYGIVVERFPVQDCIIKESAVQFTYKRQKGN